MGLLVRYATLFSVIKYLAPPFIFIGVSLFGIGYLLPRIWIHFEGANWSGLLVLMVVLVMGLTYTGSVSGQQFRTTAQVQSAIKRLETNTDRFSNSIDSALDRSRFNNTDLEDQLNALVDEFEYATDRLKDRAGDDVVSNLDVNEVLRRGMYLDMFMQRNSLSQTAERDWRLVRTDLDGLARVYGVTWTWTPSTLTNSGLNKTWTKQIIKRLEQTSDEFRNSFDAGLDRSSLNGSSYEDFMNKVVAQFEQSVDKLDHDAGASNELNPADLKIALNNAAAIDDFLRRQTLSARARRDWARVKVNLDDLAFVNSVAWNWNLRSNSAQVAGNVSQAQGERVALGRSMMNPSLSAIAREVRHELMSDLPYYSIFDWIEFEVLPDNTVVLNGEVTTPPDTKSTAQQVVADVPGVSRVVNNIRVLPVSPNDNRLRRALYNVIYGFNSPLFRYGVGSGQAIHIIVEGGRATLKGVVDSQSDKQQAYIRARGVPGLFGVTNELTVKGEGPR